MAEDPLSGYPKERTRQDVRRKDVEGDYLAYRGIEHRRNTKQRNAADAPLEGECIIWSISVGVCPG